MSYKKVSVIAVPVGKEYATIRISDKASFRELGIILSTMNGQDAIKAYMPEPVMLDYFEFVTMDRPDYIFTWNEHIGEWYVAFPYAVCSDDGDELLKSFPVIRDHLAKPEVKIMMFKNNIKRHFSLDELKRLENAQVMIDIDIDREGHEQVLFYYNIARSPIPPAVVFGLLRLP